MKRFANILLIAGGDKWREIALERAVSLAMENQADLTVVDVVELSNDLRVMGVDRMKKFTSEVAARRLVDLDNMVQHARERVAIQTRVIPGPAFLEIIREVLRHNYDLVIKMSGERRRITKLLLGSTDMHLLRKCPCPVWITKPGEPLQYRRVLAAVDVEPETGGPQKNALNSQILEMASSLALSEFGELHILHVWMRHGRTIFDGVGSGFDDAEIEEWGQQVKQMHRSWLDEQEVQLQKTLGKDTLDHLAPQIHMIEGDTCDVLTDFVEKKKVDVVVMGTVARTGIAGFIMGNTAESILNAIDCSVLAVKPPGFLTPVTLADEDS